MFRKVFKVFAGLAAEKAQILESYCCKVCESFARYHRVIILVALCNMAFQVFARSV